MEKENAMNDAKIIGAGRNAPVILLDCVDSTNDSLRRLAGEGAKAGTVLMARRQTAGRGRMSRSFASPENGLYLSILEKPRTDPERISTVTPVAAIALMRTLRKLTDLSAGEGEREAAIKWPNDVQIGGRKICGILTELHVSTDPSDKESTYQLIIGIGVNVNTVLSDLPEELRESAGSIAEATGKKLSLDAFAEALIGEFDAAYREWEEESPRILSEFREYCSTAGKEIFVIDTVPGSLSDAIRRRSAFALGIGDDFSLKVRYEDGTEENVRSGEVSVRYRA